MNEKNSKGITFSNQNTKKVQNERQKSALKLKKDFHVRHYMQKKLPRPLSQSGMRNSGPQTIDPIQAILVIYCHNKIYFFAIQRKKILDRAPNQESDVKTL